jgi:hypothetical protein
VVEVELVVVVPRGVLDDVDARLVDHLMRKALGIMISLM